MANLIIKPSAGGQLILKDEGDDAAITVATNGATTFAENTTLSGIGNNLGTVTAGSIAGGNITNATTFPAGHVIQTKRYLDPSQVSVTSNSFNTADVAGNFQFTPLVATSNILLFVCCTVYSDGNAGYLYSDIYKNASDVTENSNLSGYASGLSVEHNGGVWTMASYYWLDTCQENSLSEKTYKISGRINGGSGSGYIGWGASTPNTMVIQEITT